jgi:streptomycin 6-kinase
VSAAPRVPAGLEWWRAQPGGAAWLERLPRLVAECAAEWELTLGAPFERATISWVAPAALPDGTPAILKVSFPEPESEHEAAALAHWAGAGAVRLLRHDPARRALLVERCEPGTTLWALGDEEEANAIAAGVLRALWAAPAAEGAPFRALAGEARRWAAELPARWERQGRPFERALLDRATGWVGELLDAPGPPVVVHQDLHGGNVLRAAREPSPSTAGPGQSPLGGKPGGPWLAIDPKPLLGERAFDVASLLRDRRPELVAEPAPARRVRRRLDQLAAELDVDRERARRWGVVHALAWGVADDAVFPEIVACAGWLAEA